VDDDVYVPVGRVVVRCGRRRWTEDGDAVLGRRRDDVPLAVDAEVVRRDGARRVGDVHARAVVRVGSDQQQTALRVEREVRDVDVARGPENAAWLPVQLEVVARHLTRMTTRRVQSRLPVQQAVRVQQNADTVEVGHQLVGAVRTRRPSLVRPISHLRFCRTSASDFIACKSRRRRDWQVARCTQLQNSEVIPYVIFSELFD